MSVTYPLSLASFIETLKVRHITPYLEFRQETSSLAGGPLLVKDLAPALWRAQIETVALTNADFETAMARIESLAGSTGTFYCYDTKRRYPAYDPTGSILGGNTVLINGLNGVVELSLKGLTASYVITRGDRFHFDYSGVRGFHRFVEGVTSNGSGVTGNIAVQPYLRPGAAVDQVVTIIKPAALMRIIPGTVAHKPGLFASAISFEAIQVL